MLEGKKTAAIIQARMGSTRLPGKVMKDLLGQPLLYRIVERISLAELLDEVVIATTGNPIDDVIELSAAWRGIRVFRGSEEDVLDRYYQAAKASGADVIIRVCADNPLTEPRFIDIGARQLLASGADYVHPENIPLGSNVWTMRFEALEWAALNAAEADEREHVVPYIIKHPDIFKVVPLAVPVALQRPDLRITVDTMEDYNFMYRLYYHFRNSEMKDVPLEDIIAYWDAKASKGGERL